jgi:hypothetical protein
MSQPRKKGRFQSPYTERRGEPIALRLPLSLDQAVRCAVDWRTTEDNTCLKAWVEQAIKEKVDREA